MASRQIGIPTMYDSRLYRSRLEARWACFFDMMGWTYEYEPFDLAGWIPDFSIFGKLGEVLVEIKPASSLKGFDIKKIVRAMKDTPKEKCEVLLLGSTIFPSHAWDKGAAIGWLSEDGIFGMASLWQVSDKCYGFIHDDCSYTDRISGLRYRSIELVNYDDIRHLWNLAGNEVQWKAPYYNG